MDVAVDQPGDQAAAPGVDDFGIGTGCRAGFGLAADTQKLAVADCDRLGDRAGPDTAEADLTRQ